MGNSININNNSFMRKYLLMMAMPFIALSAFASGEENPTLNAVCVTLKSGDSKYVAFTDRPKIMTEDGKLCVLSMEDNKQLVLAEYADVEKITAESHDFTPTGVKESVVVEGKNVEEIYNIDGTKATHIVPGKIYIIKSNGKTRKVIK